MTQWIEGPLVGFDTETTGVDVRRERIVTAALVTRDAAGTSEETWLIDPGVEIPAASTAIHGISTAHAREFGLAPEVALEAVASRLAEALAAGVPVVGFNVSFDLAILEADLARHGLATLRERLDRDIAPVIDPLVLDRAVDRYRRGKRTLADLCAVYDVAVAAELHTAEVDVVATLDLLGRIAARHPAVAARDLADLHEWQVGAHRAWAENFNGWLASRGRVADVDLGWPLPASR